jgi:hypothetical protein
MICFDTEDDSCGTVKIINFFDGVNHRTYRGENCRYKSWAYLHESAPETFWACNLGYDLVNLFGPWLGKVCTLQYVKAGLMRCSFREAQITFLDTLRHWPASVEEMGKKIGLEKLSMPHLGCDCDDCVDYCRRDTEITWRFVNEMVGRYEALGLFSIRSTLPAMALQLFKEFYPKEFIEVDDYHLEIMRKGYYGGRVEVFQTGKINGVVNHYDVNSLFPSVMENKSFPDPVSINIVSKPDFKAEGIFEGKVYIPRTDIPCLPVRDDELIFPYGVVSGSWPYPEIRQLIKDGGKVLECRQAVEFDEQEYPFKEYVNFCYQKRLESKNELDSLIWKLFLNSLYGKFGQGSELEIIFNDESQFIKGKARHVNVIWSAYVTSYARLKLLGFLRGCHSLFYTDTDSVFTFDNLPVSSDLGALKLEGVYKMVEFKGNKLYCLDDKARAKGVPRKLAAEFFHTGKATYRRPIKFKEGRKRGIQPNVWHSMTKENNKEYTKRMILEDGSTLPWNISEYRQRVREGII